MLSRREFVKRTLGTTTGAMAINQTRGADAPATKRWFTISLAQWSLHRAFYSGKMDAMDFASISKNQFGIDAIEYVNSFYAKDYSEAVATDLRKRADAEGVESVLIMVDGEGHLGASIDAERKESVENHKKWVEAAKTLGCHSIRVNASSVGSFEEQQKLAADGLAMLTEHSSEFGINVVVENHGGFSSHGEWLAGVIKRVNHPSCGTLPDFGNFKINSLTGKEYDRYKGTEELMPFAKGVSAKTYAFDGDGMETTIDYPRMLKIVREAGYRGRIGVEYEGKAIGEAEGILATKKLLQSLGGI